MNIVGKGNDQAMRTEQVRTVSGTYTVHVDGEDLRKPFAVFLHGGPGFNSHGERILLGGRFRSEVNFLWFDLLGCGEFQASVSTFSWDRQIRDIAHVIRHFTGDPVYLLGHCLGTAIIHDLVRQDRDLAKSVLWYSPTRSVGEVFRRVLRRGMSEGRLPPHLLTPTIARELDRFLRVPDHELGAGEVLL
jgi:pimeloyl-ACP methyl ester carboxylesterase